MLKTVNRRKRRPVVAILLAMVGPGLGHLYSGNFGLAVGLAVAVLAFVNVLYLLIINAKTERSDLLIFFGAGCLGYILHSGHAWWTAKHQLKDFSLRRYNRWYYYVIWFLALVTLVLFTGTVFGDYRSYQTPSSSMEGALLWGERFVADMKAYEIAGPARGDVAIFICPCDGTTLYLKRCMAVSGDTVEFIDKKLFINGVPVEEPATVQFTDTTESGEPRIHARPAVGVDSRDNYGPREVPVGEFFMIGDNRDNSLDSRYWGFVPKEMFLGKAVRVYFSSDRSRIGLRVE